MSRVSKKLSSNNSNTPPLGTLVDDHEQARLLGCSVHFLRKDRITKRQIPFVRIGDLIRYDPIHVRETLLANKEGGVAK